MSYDLVTVGGDSKHQTTFLHEVVLRDHDGKEHTIQAFQIDDVCGRLQSSDVSAIVDLFPGLKVEEVQRPDGPIELLIGMPHANIHPTRIEAVDNLVLYESIFGTKRILGGCHPSLVAMDQLNAHVQGVARGQITNT